eukprot:GHVQ01031357.1.p2 GENE.GHVQ01031357.1~~GHVQ01031357.1.p2  ORF type:complete len:129 (+),score=19.50 GHVQ01031357.1:907-1293(+)
MDKNNLPYLSKSVQLNETDSIQHRQNKHQPEANTLVPTSVRDAASCCIKSPCLIIISLSCWQRLNTSVAEEQPSGVERQANERQANAEMPEFNCLSSTECYQTNSTNANWFRRDTTPLSSTSAIRFQY